VTKVVNIEVITKKHSNANLVLYVMTRYTIRKVINTFDQWR